LPNHTLSHCEILTLSSERHVRQRARAGYRCCGHVRQWHIRTTPIRDWQTLAPLRDVVLLEVLQCSRPQWKQLVAAKASQRYVVMFQVAFRNVTELPFCVAYFGDQIQSSSIARNKIN